MKNPPLHKASDLSFQAQSVDESSMGPVTYPGVAAIEVRWQKQVLGAGWHQQYREPWLVVEPRTLGEFIDCPDPECIGGGCCIGAVIRDTVAMKATRRRGRVRCKGQKGSDGKRRWRLCITVFKYDVRIQYRDEAVADPSGVLPKIPASAVSDVQRRAG
jgi:hypothetical protein